MESEDGQLFIKRIAHFVRTHEKALANALQVQQRRQPVRRGSDIPGSPRTPVGTAREPSSGYAASSLASALTLPFTQSLKPARLALTPHHLYYLLTRFEELNIAVGPMGVRLENIHAEASPANYVSFLSDSSTQRNRSSDSLSIHSMSSSRIMSDMSSIWSNFGFGPSIATRNERAKAALQADLKYLYSAFTKVPCLKLAPDRKARLVEGFEEFPFDTAVPLLAFKNVSTLEICDIDIRQFFGWDRMAEQLQNLVVKRAGIEDPAELLISIVLDDMDRRRRRSAKTQSSPIISYGSSAPGHSSTDVGASLSGPPSPSPQPAVVGAHAASAPVGHYHNMSRGPSESSHSSSKNRPRSSSPSKSSGRPTSHRMRRSGSGSSHSSAASTALPSPISLPPTKWRMLRHLSLSDNGLHCITTAALVPLAGSLTSLDLSSNLLAAIPESLSILSNLRALNLSGNMIDSLHSLTRNPLPAITSLNLRGNRLSSIAGIERALTLERLDLRQNKLTDPTELARLTSAPNFTAVWVAANPFTKTHSSSYRTTIFNLFRNTPGYTDDVLLDSQGPGMMEKRSLIERVAEAPSVPVVKVPKQQPVTVHQVTSLDSGKKKDNRTDEKSIPSEVARAKRKTGRRRAVELGRENSNNLGSDGTDAQSVRALVRSPTNPAARTQSLSTKKQHHLVNIDAIAQEDASSGAESSPPPSLPNDNVDWSIRGDEYRRKVEALKNEVGSGWLSVLSEEGLSLASTRKASPSDPPR